MTMYKKEFAIIDLREYTGMGEITVRELRDSVVKGLNAGLRYISIIAPDGSNRAEEAGHTCDDIVLDEYIIIEDENGDIDIEKTADAVCKDMIVTGMIIVMRNAYEELKDINGTWIDKILEDDDD